MHQKSNTFLETEPVGRLMIADPEIEAVICTTADPFHERYVLAAIAAGKPVFCEKPLSPTPEVYTIEFQRWINATKEGRIDGPSAWDGYVAQVTAAAASKARDLQQPVDIVTPETPAFYK